VQIIGHVIDRIVGTAILNILLYYCYQMKIVQLKLESKDVNSYLKHFRKAKTLFSALIVTSVIAEGFEIPWTVIIEKNNDNDDPMPSYLLGIGITFILLKLILQTVLIYQ
jgi:hypothetical protein